MIATGCNGGPGNRRRRVLAIAMEIRTFAELIAPDQRTLRFTPLGLSTGGVLNPYGAAELKQQVIASADLTDAVPDGVRSSFERLRMLHSYGVLWYDAFTVAGHLSLLLLQQALRDRFVELYGGAIPLEKKSGDTSPESSAKPGSKRRGTTNARLLGGLCRVRLDGVARFK